MNSDQFSSFLADSCVGRPADGVLHSSRLNGHAKRKAVVVGLNYGWVQPGWQIPFLKGGVSDALRMQEVLVRYYGFREHEIQLLIDSGSDGDSPTRENVLASLDWLMADTKSGDTRVFYYAGHTAAVFTPPQHRMDNTLATLCVVDGLVFTYEIWNYTGLLPAGCMISCIIDAPFGQFMLNVPIHTPPDPPFSFAEDPRAAIPGMRFLPPRQPPSGFVPPNLANSPGLPSGVNGFILCACGKRDVARELRAGLDGNSESGGLFTQALCETMCKIAGNTMTVMQVYEMVKHRMLEHSAKENGGPQCPSLCWSPSCPPEVISFILPAAEAGVSRHVYLDDGQVSEHRGLCCPSKPGGKSKRSHV